MYHQFRATFQTAMIYWGDYRAGTFTNGAGGSGSADKMFNNALDSSETKGTNWGSSYTTINNANLILRHVPGIAFSDENQKNLILANAHFVRAYTYYNIARVWGDAPLLLEGFESSDNDLQPSRSDAALIYEQVARDIDDALRLMPASAADCTIATRSAVQMLKADYNLWLYQTREGGDDALTAADEALAEVFKDSRLDLIGSYADIFDITKKNNAEIILTLHFGQGEYEGGYAETYLIPQTRFHSASEHIETHVKLMTANDQRFIFSPSLVELLYKDERDTRTPVSYGDWTDEEEVSAYLGKLLSREAGDRTGLIYGMGHAIYTLSDPRAVILKKFARDLAESKGMLDEFRLYEAVERLTPQAMAAHGQRKVVCANVDLFSGFVYKMMGIPMELYTPLFAMARMVGWCAHRMEELYTPGGRIIRPAYKVVAPLRPFVPLEER